MDVVVIVIVIVVVLLAVAGVAALVIARRRRQRELADEFGPEYERRVAETGDRKQAEKELRERKDRHDQHELRPLQPDERERFHADWQQVQRGFVDDPGGAVEHADALVVTIMRQRGYPIEDGQRRTDDLSVAQPHLVEDYRHAQRVTTAHRDGTASTEDLRGAFTAFRSLVEALLDDDGGDRGGDHGGDRGGAHGGAQDGAHGAGAPGAGPAGSTERIQGPGGGAPGQAGGHPDAGTERIAPGGAPGPGGQPGGPAPGQRPTAPPAGGPDGHQERRR
ncbi:hypothetical protein ACQPX6_01060 [Actinomycetospora sp. CA-101289]|uniref:hypothetical protein n=1 Tax=Actinomycetospora sp. CA-101289 TaxID=3239893 RepID=UPI003D989B21